MPYDVVTKINNVIVSSHRFDGFVAKTETQVTKPTCSFNYQNYYYFNVNGRTVKAGKNDTMTVEQINVFNK